MSSNKLIVKPALKEKPGIDPPSIILWVLSSILFFLFSGTIAPYFWFSGPTDADSGNDLLKTILGIAGIITYLIEPVILAIYTSPVKENTPYEKNIFTGQGLLSSIMNMLIFLLLMFPMLICSFFRPVFRAVMLAICFSYLHLPGPESLLFVMIVLSDILLYYLNMWFPKWHISPAYHLARYFIVNKKRYMVHAGGLFFMFYTALVYSFWCSLGYYNEPGHQTVKGEREVLLLFTWLTASVYIRAPFISDDIDALAALKKIPGRALVLHIIVLLISFAGYMWPYFFNHR